MEPAIKVWKDADGNIIDDDKLFDWINKSKNDIANTSELIVGTDSHLHKYNYRFVTVVCIYKKGRGGFYYYTTTEHNKKEFKGNYPARVRARMFHEASITIEVASKIQNETGQIPVIHVDASPPEAGEMTSLFSDQLKGYVTASGFECIIKPWSFVSSGIANKHTKG